MNNQRAAMRMNQIVFVLITVVAIFGFYIFYQNNYYKSYCHQAILEESDEESGQDETAFEEGGGQTDAAPIFNRFGAITDCISGRLVGKLVPNSDIRSVPLEVPDGKSFETDETRQKSFIDAFRSKVWEIFVDEDRKKEVYGSGLGATLLYAQEMIAGLHVIITQVKQRFGLSRIRLLDLPCGDMTFMNRFLETRDDVDYTGMDIVPELIANHSSRYKDRPNWKFRVHDIVKKPLNESYDIILSRHMLQHLYNRDVLKSLKHFSDSGSRFLLASNVPSHPVNDELPPSTNNWRFHISNLEIPPFSLVPPVCLFRDGPDRMQMHFIAMWKLPLETISHCNATYSFKIPTGIQNTHSCTNWGLE